MSALSLMWLIWCSCFCCHVFIYWFECCAWDLGLRIFILIRFISNLAKFLFFLWSLWMFFIMVSWILSSCLSLKSENHGSYNCDFLMLLSLFHCLCRCIIYLVYVCILLCRICTCNDYYLPIFPPLSLNWFWFIVYLLGQRFNFKKQEFILLMVRWVVFMNYD